MAEFYHVSTLLTHNGQFTPRIPKNRLEDVEDATMERICVAPSIEKCLSALPGGGNFVDANFKRRGYYILFRIDTEKLGIDDSDIVPHETLFENNWVPDACITEEHWITSPFQVPEEESIVIKLNNWKPVQVRVGDRGFVNTITSIHYQKEDAVSGNVIRLLVHTAEEEKVLRRYVIKHHQVEFDHPMKGELVFRLKEDANLRMLFYFHMYYVLKHSLDDWDEDDIW